MTITYELDLNNFDPWSGAVSTLDRIRNENKVSDLEYLLEELYPQGMSETELNDLLWFESDWIYENLGLETYDSILDKIDILESDIADLKEEIADLNSDILSWLEDEEATETEIKENIHDIELDIEFKQDQIAELEEEITDLKKELSNF